MQLTDYRWKLLFIALILVLLAAAAISGCGSSSENILTSGSGSPPAEPPLSHSPPATTDSGDSTNKISFEPLGFPATAPSPAQVLKVPVLMFHHVGEPPAGADEIRHGLTVSAADFEAMMGYLKQAGYSPVSQKQLFKALFKGEKLPANPVMITLDDGYDDNFTVAAPILAKYGFPATFYIITDNVGSPEYMTWDQITKLDGSGMDIGSHTTSHPDLSSLSAAELKRELKDSEAALEKHLGHPVYWLCYPAGKFDADVEQSARDAGYLLAVTTKPGEQQSSDAPYELWRYRVRSDTGLAGFKELVR